MQFLKANIDRPFTFISCGQFISEGNWIHSQRILDSFEIIIGVKGHIFIQQEEERYVVNPGDMLLLLPNCVHQGYACSDINASFYWMHFYCKENYRIMDQRDVFREIAPLKTNPCFSKLTENIVLPVHFSPEKTDRLFIQFKQLQHIVASDYISTYAADYMLTALLIELSQQALNNIFRTMDSTIVNNHIDNVFITMLEWIRINIHKDISIKEIAEKFNFNQDYLTRLFKRHLGISTKHYINGSKISKAKQLLCQTDKNIKEIAFELGFKDEKYFMKLFKEYENLTPTNYRNAYYNTHLNIR